MWYLLLLAATGAILTLFYVFWIKIFGDQLTKWMRHAALLIVLAAHVVPLVGVKSFYSKLLDRLLPVKMRSLADVLMRMAAVRTASKRYITPYFALTLLFSAVWVICFTRKFFKLCVPYFKSLWYINKIYEQCRWEEALQMLEGMRKKGPFRRRIRVIKVEDRRSPCTLGVLRPVMVLHCDLKDRELEWTLRHELTHIARGDVAFKLLWQIVSCIFWFNPALEKFAAQFNLLTEEACDEKVTEGFTAEERMEYIKLIAKNLNLRPSPIYVSALSGDMDHVRERIQAIVHPPERKMKKKYIAVIVFLLFMFVDSLVSLAYPDVYYIRNDAQEKLFAEGKGVWAYEWTDAEVLSQAYEVWYAEEFIDESGRILPIDPSSDQTACAEHRWISGEIQCHIKTETGGCKIEMYHGTYCKDCHTAVKGDMYAFFDYENCKHVPQDSSAEALEQ